jgi:putative membrane protein
MFGAGVCSGMGAGGWALMIGVWVTVIGVVVWAVTRIFPADASLRDAQRRLDRRLAAGEIDPRTYHAIQEELTGRQSTAARR